MTHRSSIVLALSLTTSLACDASSPKPSSAAPTSAKAVSSAPAAAAQEGAGRAARHFGAEEQLAGEAVPVEQVLAAADAHVGSKVKCSGVVGRVCQAAGCWLELQPTAGGEGLRVPMANHAFFIPQDAVGQLAVVEGELKRHPLPPEQRDHYASEGMKAMGPLSLEATSVTLR